MGQLRLAAVPQLVRRVSDLCVERNAREGLILDLRELSDATDFFLIASGESDVHVRAISEHVIDQLARSGIRPAGIEGSRAARWVLIDYIDLVVHVFHPVTREFYQLERLWGDAPMVPIEDSSP